MPGSVAEAIFGEPTEAHRELVERQLKARTTLWTSLALFSIVACICLSLLCIKFTSYLWGLM